MNGDERQVPHDAGAEESVIASLMVDARAFDAIEGIIAAGDFRDDRARWTFEACVRLHARGETVNEITVAHELATTFEREGSARSRLDEIGGPAYLARVTSDLPTPIGVEHYAGIVANARKLRDLIAAGSRIVTRAYAGGDAAAVVAEAEQLIRGVEPATSGEIYMLREVLDEYWDRPGVYAGGETRLIRTGFVDLEKLLGGLRAADLIIVGARPSMGKSALLLNLGRNAAVGQGMRVLIASIEMRRSEWAIRALAGEAGIDSKRIQLWNMGEDEEARAMNATAMLAGLDIALVDFAHLTVTRLRRSIRAAARRMGGVDLVVVDYLQLMKGEDRRANRLEQITEISRELKLIAREFDLPVVAASQLSRKTEGMDRKVKRPMLSDLRDSGAIEQDADVALLMWRPDYYTKRDEWKGHGAYPEGQVEVIVAKNRNGPTGSAWLRFDRALSRFSDLEQLDEPEPEYQGAAPWAK